MQLNERVDVLLVLVACSLHFDNWLQFILAHPDHRYASYVHTGLSYGFWIGFNRHSITLHSSVWNQHSAFVNRGQVQD